MAVEFRSTLTATETVQPLTLVLRVRGRVDSLLGIMEAHAGWDDPLSRKINGWALRVYDQAKSLQEETLTEGLRKASEELDGILVSSLDGKKLTEIPYLVNGKYVLPESDFISYRHKVKCANSSQEVPHKVHSFAQDVLKWQGALCEPAPPIPAVLWLDPSTARCMVTLLDLGMQGKQRLQKDRDDEKEFLAQAARFQSLAQETQQQQNCIIAEMVAHFRGQQEALNCKLDAMAQSHQAKLRELQEEIEKTREEVRNLRAQVATAHQVNQQHQGRIESLEARIRMKEAELAQIRAQIDDDTCVIL